MSVLDAAKRLAQAQEGGVPALAARMAMNHNTLYHKLSGANGHNLFARELELMTTLTGNPEIAQAFAAACNHICVPMAPQGIAGTELAEHVSKLGVEFGDMMRATLEAIADGRVTDRELANFDNKFHDFLTGAVTLREDLRSRIPKPPGLKVAK